MLDRQFFQCGHDEVVGFPEGEAVGEVDGVGRLDDVVPRFLDEKVLHFLGERTLVSFPCLAKLPHQFHGSCGEGVAGGFVGDTHRKIREVAVVGARVLRIEESPLAHEHVDLQVHLLADRNILRQKIACCDPSPDPAPSAPQKGTGGCPRQSNPSCRASATDTKQRKQGHTHGKACTGK